MSFGSSTVVAALLALTATAALAQPAAKGLDPDAQTGLENAKYGDPDAISTVFFALGSAHLTASARGWLDDAVLRRSKLTVPITVGRHTDAVGGAKYNEDL